MKGWTQRQAHEFNEFRVALRNGPSSGFVRGAAVGREETDELVRAQGRGLGFRAM
jgi:hypothetical protein